MYTSPRLSFYLFLSLSVPLSPVFMQRRFLDRVDVSIDGVSQQSLSRGGIGKR